MAIDHDLVPDYVVLLNDHQPLKLNHRRVSLGQPSDDLIAFAKERGTRIAIDVSAWDEFAADFGLSRIDRERHCCFITRTYQETDEELQRLIDL